MKKPSQGNPGRVFFRFAKRCGDRLRRDATAVVVLPCRWLAGRSLCGKPPGFPPTAIGNRPCCPGQRDSNQSASTKPRAVHPPSSALRAMGRLWAPGHSPGDDRAAKLRSTRNPAQPRWKPGMDSFSASVGDMFAEALLERAYHNRAFSPRSCRRPAGRASGCGDLASCGMQALAWARARNDASGHTHQGRGGGLYR